MKRKIPFDWQKVFFAILILSSFFLTNSFSVHAQNPPGISISWDKEIGCQIYREDKDDFGTTFLENIGPSDCIRFCEDSYVTYTLANLPSGATTAWNAVGGTIISSNSTSCQVLWAAIGAGSLSFTITNGNSIITKTICIEKVAKPIALFTIAPGTLTPPFEVCIDQVVNFINQSSANNGTSLVSYLWDFGDGTTSSAFEPSHAYASSGVYTVLLTVKNECNCTAVYKIKITVKGTGFVMDCINVVCEGQTAIYTLPSWVSEGCGGNFPWSVVGGQIISNNNGQVEVLWDNVGPSGFGYLTFDPSGCGLDCAQPATFKVPVVAANGTITGPTDLCLGEQGRYKLPQWPTTDIQWQITVGSGNIIQTDQRNEVIVTPTASGTITLVATYTNTLLKCGGIAVFTINVGEPLTISGESVICQNTTETYTNSAGISVNWTLTTNTGTPVTTQSGTTFNYTFSQAGNYILTANQTGYCAGEQKTITVIGLPSAPTGINGDLFVCPNAPYTYAVQSPVPASNYLWEILPTDGSIIGSDVGDQVNITFNGNFPATVNVYQQTISPIECLSPPFGITINQIPINAEIASPLPFAVCANTLATYSANVPGTSTPHTDGDNYTWSFANANGSVIASSLGSVTNGQGTNAIDVTWNNVTVTTTLDLVLTVSKCNITTQFTQQITLYPKPEIEVVASPTTVCSGPLYPVTFTVQSINGVPLIGTDVVSWNVNGSSLPPSSPGVFTLNTSLNNPASSNVGQIITAYITTDCGVSNTASVTVTVLPNPPAVATLTSAANSFCTLPEVFATITASTNSTGVTFQWYQNGTNLITGATGSSINVTPSNQGPGAYTVHTTNPNSCVSISNPVSLFLIPCDTVCTVSQTVTNTSYLSACGQITFVGSVSGTPISQGWQVLGVSPSDYTVVGNILTGIPGNYKIIHWADYPCTLNGITTTVTVNEIIDVVIPYEPDFSYVVECTGSNSFNVDFIDNSNFYALVNPKNVRFYYKLTSAGSFTGPISYNPATGTGNFEITGLSPGSYVFRQEVDGGNPIGLTCSLEFTVNLQGINPGLAITYPNPIACHNTPVQFGINFGTLGSTRFWDFNDAGAQTTITDPKRVFNTPNQTYNVTCLVTNQFGCSSLLTAPIYIPDECFFGDVVSNPSPAEVCQNETIDISYQATPGECPVGSYVWMDGNTPVPGGPYGSTITVSSTGFYWVKVFSTAGCRYATPTQIKPLFKTLPNVKLIGESSFCEIDDIMFHAVTNEVLIEWFIGTTPYTQFSNLTDADFTGLLTVGNYTVTVEVTSADGCVNSASQNFTIEAPITDINFVTSFNCNPYQVVIQANPTPNLSGIIYNWSSGQSTQTITVPNGGPYQVTASLGGCSFSKEIDIPKNPEDYIWIFPTGCYTGCEGDWDIDPTYLIGPTLPLPYWSWNQNGGAVDQGFNSYQTPYTLTQDGFYTSTLNTGPCDLESGTLDYTVKPCEHCEIDGVEIVEVYEIDGPYCTFSYMLNITSASSLPINMTISDLNNNVLILPSSHTLITGVNTIYLTVIPQSPFNGGVTTWIINGSMLINGEYVDCTFKFEVDVPVCSGPTAPKGILQDETNTSLMAVDLLKIFPNPASDMVQLNYNLTKENAELEIYDLSGRSISKHTLTSAKGELKVNTSNYQSGIYMVVVKQNNAIVWQQKLAIE